MVGIRDSPYLWLNLQNRGIKMLRTLVKPINATNETDFVFGSPYRRVRFDIHGKFFYHYKGNKVYLNLKGI